MIYKLELPLKLPSLNEYVRVCRGNKYASANLKKDIEDEIIYYIKKQVKTQIKEPVVIKFTWIETSKKRDLDNIAFAKKFILDALVKSGVLKNDNYKFVKGFKDVFKFEKENKVIVELEEIK